ncbi:hypothetical protein [Antarctobacter sp.]|uniref:hypothetical protein n=1 Tax=Antarctobacter sp. TaxID=1872577 RepID=UPI003A94C36C
MFVRVDVGLISDGELAFLRFRGAQSVRGTLEALAMMRALPGYCPGLPELVDLSGITETNLDFHGMRRISHEAGSRGISATRIKMIAVYAPQDTLYGMARMFATLTDLHQGNVRAAAFRSEIDSLAWLGRSETRFIDIPGHAVVGQD